uniref:Uncharacterized protein n=1 Tax=Timema monikensis TaxID=170555 RepID=A0A7R9E5C7_9NEOP|nr:unnamed protein product [Timema monikensis]
MEPSDTVDAPYINWGHTTQQVGNDPQVEYCSRAIQEQMRVHGQEPILFEDVKDEVFDMVKPANPAWITLQDLVNCGQGDTVVTILIDLNGFWTYENREAMAADTGDPAPDHM